MVPTNNVSRGVDVPTGASASGEGALADSANFRDRRLLRVAETQRRRETLIQAAPHADPQFVNAVAAADRFWDADEQWRTVLASQLEAEPSTATPAGPLRHQAEATPRGRRQRPRWRRPRAAAPATPIADSAAPPQTAAAFDVPAPGRRQIGRGRTWMTRLLLVVGPLIFCGGLAYSFGVTTGSTRLVQPSALTVEDAAAYHLTRYPAQQAAAFGVTYLTLCLSRPDPGQDGAAADRLAALARMTSSGVAAGCGGEGAAAAAAPATVTWNGSAEPITGVYADGAAAHLGFTVTAHDGRTYTAALPVWAADGAAGGMRVVGNLALLPTASAVPAPRAAAAKSTDPLVRESLTRNVLLPFFQAWGASDPVQLQLVLASTASPAARAGMQGQLTAPALAGAQVSVTRGDPAAYREGDMIAAAVTVDWTTRVGGAHRASYTVSLRLIGSRWQVLDVRGAAPDPAGGAAAGTAFTSPEPTTPAPAG